MVALLVASAGVALFPGGQVCMRERRVASLDA
jgi:hypothetical protein